jgi:hypothetical protein
MAEAILAQVGWQKLTWSGWQKLSSPRLAGRSSVHLEWLAEAVLA